ncbi:MAG: hypothetical protein ACT4OI_08755, partial [Methanobacteriota archaeon]
MPGAARRARTKVAATPRRRAPPKRGATASARTLSGLPIDLVVRPRHDRVARYAGSLGLPGESP